jgi:hypothetical protein
VQGRPRAFGVAAGETQGVDVCAVVYEADDQVVLPRQSDVEGEHTVEDRVDGLATGEGVLDESDVPICSSGVEAQLRDYPVVSIPCVNANFRGRLTRTESMKIL